MSSTAAPALRENKMGIMPVGKLLFTMALPLAISMLVQAFAVTTTALSAT